MINFQLYSDLGSNGHFKLESTTYLKCAELIAFGRKNISNGLAVGVDDCSDSEVPFLHFQQCGNLAFFQIFISNGSSLADEGWYCLCENAVFESEEERFLVVNEASDRKEEYFEARFSPGVFFSRKLLTNTEVIVNYLKSIDAGGHSSCFHEFEWEYLGLV